MKIFIGLLLLWATILAKCSAADFEDYVARVDEGFVRGIKDITLEGREFFSFQGLPFAKPPLGELRFKDPVAAEPWKGVLNATSEPKPCLQYGFFEHTIDDMSQLTPAGQEDCLYLNVYTPAPKNLQAKLPVMVFIHGGGFLSGGANEYQPQLLMDKEIVLVVLQYRLSIFGFLSTEDSLLPGNMGLKDQQLALKWVRRNILNFGGDPDKVTIFGESAGAGSVHFHILSPGSKGLFNRAIMQSGSAVNPWSVSENHKKYAQKVGDQVQCSLKEGTESYLKCMQKIDAKLLLRYTEESLKWALSPEFTVPRVDGIVIPDRPELLLKRGDYTKVDMMMGWTRDEGAIFNLMFCFTPGLLEKLNNDFEEYGPLSLMLENEPQKVSSEIYDHYLPNKEIKVNDKRLIQLYTDWYFIVGMGISSLFHASDEETSVYTYQLDHQGPMAFGEIQDCSTKNFISHCDDLVYLFHGGPLFTQTLEKEEDIKMGEIIRTLWTNFAETGNPTSSGLDFEWERATPQNHKHLSLLTEPKMVDDHFHDTLKFWLSREIKQMLNIVSDERLKLNEGKSTTKQKQEL